MKSVELLKECPDVLDFYRNKFRYIMVDEYQDTSKAQYELIKLLAKQHQNICVVGDDDQSIYGWRGADIRNILEFERDYDNVKIVKLEQNYRSTQVILDAANHVIANNTERKRKRLWSDKKEGQLIKIQLAENEIEEGDFIVNTISYMKRYEDRDYKDFAVLYRANAQARSVEDALNRAGIPYNIYGGIKFYERKEIKDIIAYLRVIQNPQDDISLKRIINVPRRGIGLRIEEGDFIVNTISYMKRYEDRDYKDFAVLYRANAQARSVEDALNRAGIPYNIYGGIKFYERKEIKDIIAYLRVIQNPQDDISLKRIINVPRRGIGLRTIEKIEDRASLKEESIYSVLIDIEDNSDISRKARASISEFVDLMSTLRSFTGIYTVSQIIEKVLDVTGYKDELLKEKNNEGEDRLENLEELISVALEFESTSDDKSLDAFLTGVALNAEPDSEEEPEDRVSLMTIHSSKGLEFPVVFLAGMEEKIFPIARAIQSMRDSDIEEERRLCYVGITRAKEELFLTLTRKRTLYGRTNPSIASRFIEELPDECIERLNKDQKELSFSKANYNILDKYTQKYKMNNMNKVQVAKKANATIKNTSNESNIDDLKLGAKVYHPKFGLGTVVALKGPDVTIAFDNQGIKTINKEYTTLDLV